MSVFPLDDIRPGARLVRIASGSLDRAIIGLMALVGRQIAAGATLIVLELAERDPVHPVTAQLLVRFAERLGPLDVGFCVVQRGGVVDAVLGEASAACLIGLYETVEEALRVPR